MSLTPHLRMPDVRAQTITRVRQLRPDSPRAWGRMTPHQMVWHVKGTFYHALGELELPNASTWFLRHVVRRVALHTAMTWPKGSPTSPVLNATRQPAPSTPFDADIDALCEVIERFGETDVDGNVHAAFGSLTQDEWQHWGWRHTDHHLRQFNL